MKYITTNSIDAAAYIQLHGIPCKVIPIQGQDNTYRFPDTKDVNVYLEKYLKGDVQVSLQAFMYTRMILKREGNMRLKVRVIPPVGADSLKKGTPYWYTENGVVFNAVYTESEPHITRVIEKRVFQKKQDALNSLKLAL